MPRHLTLEAKELVEHKVLASLEVNPRLTLRAAAKKAGISHATLYCLMDERPGFHDAVRKAQAAAQKAAVDAVEETMFTRATNPRDPQGVAAGLAILRARRKDIYGDSQGLLNNGTVINIGSITVVPREPPAELLSIDVDPLPPAP